MIFVSKPSICSLCEGETEGGQKQKHEALLGADVMVCTG
jgi:hypothetical protein